MPTNTPGNFGERYHTNQVHYLVKRISYADFTTANVAVTVGWLPPRAIVKAGQTYVITGFNDLTGDDLDIGVAGGDDDWFASAVDLNAAVQTVFDDLTYVEAYSASARRVTANFTTAATGDGTAGEAIVYVEFYIAPSVS